MDFNGDNRLDLAFGLNDGPLTLFSRQGNQDSPERRLKVSLRGKEGNPHAIGALLTLNFSDGSTQIREIQAGQGYLSQSLPIAWFGLGDKVPTTIEVRWTDGKITMAKVEKEQKSLILSAP